MKRYFLFILCLALALPLWGDNVTAERASEVARAFFQRDRNVARRMAPIQRIERAAVPLTKAAPAEPAFHIFNRAGGGFVIIAADDACNPILGYSFTNQFRVGPDMPDGLNAWLDDLEEQVMMAREDGAPQRQQALAKWDAVFVQTKAGEDGYKPAVKHETPTWGQNEPFNDLAPTVGGEKAVSGCVPLAMSMLARFFGYPAAGTGSVPGYNYTAEDGTTQTIEGITLGEPYLWDRMKMSYADGYTAEEAAAVAQLVYDCGVMVKAEFGLSTSANTFEMAAAAAEYLGYDAGAVGYYRSFYSDEVWLDMLKKELQNHPVLYSARREGGGHSFLVDGYDERGFLSVNWGWSGNNNGYYALSAFTPKADRHYTLKHGAVFGLVPDAGGKPVEYLYLLSGTSSSGTEYNGLEPLDEIIPRHTFRMKVGGICNGSTVPFEGQFILALTDSEGKIKDFVCGSQMYDVTNPRSWRGYSEVSCILNTYPAPGDQIRGFYRSLIWAEDDWRPFECTVADGTVDAIPVFDNQTLAEATDFAYSKTLKMVTINTKDHVTWSLKSSNGTEVKEGVSYAGVQLVIDSSALKGAYTLTLKRDSDQYTLKLTF